MSESKDVLEDIPKSIPKGIQPKGVPKGIQPKRSAVAKLASSEVIAAMKQPVPSGQLEPMSQSFAGVPSPTPKTSTSNPLLQPAKRIPKKIPESSLQPPPIKKYSEKTPDYHARIQEIDENLQENINTKMKK